MYIMEIAFAVGVDCATELVWDKPHGMFTNSFLKCVLPSNWIRESFSTREEEEGNNPFI
jgi:hypothetical protein